MYPIRIEYNLTDLGRAFEPVLLAAASFSMIYMPRIVFKDGKSRVPGKLSIEWERYDVLPLVRSLKSIKSRLCILIGQQIEFKTI